MITRVQSKGLSWATLLKSALYLVVFVLIIKVGTKLYGSGGTQKNYGNFDQRFLWVSNPSKIVDNLPDNYEYCREKYWYQRDFVYKYLKRFKMKDNRKGQLGPRTFFPTSGDEFSMREQAETIIHMLNNKVMQQMNIPLISYISIIISILTNNFQMHGTFVEIGARDGVKKSRTLKLEIDYGWSGILIEPVPPLYQKMLETKRQVGFFDVCVSTKPFPMNVSVTILSELRINI